MVNKDGQMEKYMLVTLRMILSTEKVNLSMMITRPTKGSG